MFLIEANLAADHSLLSDDLRSILFQIFTGIKPGGFEKAGVVVTVSLVPSTWTDTTILSIKVITDHPWWLIDVEKSVEKTEVIKKITIGFPELENHISLCVVQGDFFSD
jgi:hypothetical protein